MTTEATTPYLMQHRRSLDDLYRELIERRKYAQAHIKRATDIRNGAILEEHQFTDMVERLDRMIADLDAYLHTDPAAGPEA